MHQKINDSDKERSFFGYASVFNVLDHQNDIVLPGAFHSSLQSGQDVKLLWQHDFKKPIGNITKICEDLKGLYIECNIIQDLFYGKEACILLKNRIIQHLSIGYNPKDYFIDKRTKFRYIKSVHLWEVSLVTFGANKFATIQSIDL